MSYHGYKKYKTVTEERQQIQKSLDSLRKQNKEIEPVLIEGRKIAHNWWGLSWNKNLEGYADYSNRIGRGKRYVKNGAVLDLKISKGRVSALVQGSRKRPYNVVIDIDPLSDKKWKSILGHYSHQIDSLQALIEGEFPEALAETFTAKGGGLFPSPQEIHFECSCPDWASMCKHVAAVLYGIGARFDKDPSLFFLLREIEFEELVKKSIEQKMDEMMENSQRESKRELINEDIMALFNLED